MSDSCVWSTALLSFSLCLSFVGVLYLPCFYGDRNQENIIKRRSTVMLSLAFVFYLITEFFTSRPTLVCTKMLSLNKQPWCDEGSVVIESFIAMCSLFLGPCFTIIIDTTSCIRKGLSLRESLKRAMPLLPTDPWILIRNLLVAPVSEEIVFRSCICSLWNSCRGSFTAISISSFLFAASHCHHMFYRSFVYKSIHAALLGTIVQFTYTLLFGVYSSWIYLRCNCIIGCQISSASGTIHIDSHSSRCMPQERPFFASYIMNEKFLHIGSYSAGPTRYVQYFLKSNCSSSLHSSNRSVLNGNESYDPTSHEELGNKGNGKK
eukprot:jgi/Galph1/725/GphlegSOOS_G5491.1